MPMALGKAAFLGMLTLTPGAAEETESPNEPIPKPECDASIPVSIRYSSTSSRLYLESVDGSTRGGCVTLPQIWEHQKGTVPVYAVDPQSGDISDNSTGTWLLTEDVFVEDGITLQVHGSSAGGEADELRLLSTSDTFINLRAHGGSLDFLSTKEPKLFCRASALKRVIGQVFSWDTATNAPDKDDDNGRSYISAVSEVITDDSQSCKGRAKKNMGEARMDIEDSEMGYLGYNGTESYGLTWKVRGFCADETNQDVFEDVNVYGNIYDSDIHHNHFGVYSYGHQQGDWRRNKIHDNSGYGFDPHDDSDFLTIHDNDVYDNGYHGIIASKRCNGVSIQGNEVYGGASSSAGIFLHRSSDDAVVKGNYVHDNGDAGLAMLESFDADVSDNIFENNKYGVRFSVGCGHNVFSKNVISGSAKYNTYSYLGFNAPDVVESGRSQDNIFQENTIIGGLESIKLMDADGTQFIGNTFKDATTIRFNDATKTLMSGNIGLNNSTLKVKNGAYFDPRSDSGFEPIG